MKLERRTGGYLPIADYALIGDCRSAALVGEDGSIDWLCLPRFDDASVFARILDAERGGYWQLEPQGALRVQQRYRDLTNILDTVVSTGTGQLQVTDFMPVSEATLRVHARPHTGPRVIRIVQCLGGTAVLRHGIHPAPDYARADAMSLQAGDLRLHGSTDVFHLCFRGTVAVDRPQTTHAMRAGDVIAFSLSCSEAGVCPVQPWTVEVARDLLRETQEYWWRWAGRITYQGPYHQPVHRSALALKLMTYAPTGAIIAAPTTSLPEEIGGERNWDYRFTWLRDASFTLYAFFQLGLVDEARSFFGWLTNLGIGRSSGELDNLYTIDGARDQGERVLPHLHGYRGSAPVRVGNAAARQLQLDVYGELLDSAYLYARFGGEISPALWAELAAIIELAIARWEQPDSSIWEVRGDPQHFTYSKVMCWVAVDRGLRIAERFGLEHDSERWRAARRAIHRRVIAQGWNEELGSFTQALGGRTCDAAVLRMSQVRFLGDRDPRMRSTVEVTARTLREGELMRRYLVEETGDGVRGDEGAFLTCAFWLADAYAHMGELEQAQRNFEQLLCFASPVGLYSEEADVATGALLGNHPQAFTHLALVGAAVNIERARHRSLGVRGLSTPGRAGHGGLSAAVPPPAPRAGRRRGSRRGTV